MRKIKTWPRFATILSATVFLLFFSCKKDRGDQNTRGFHLKNILYSVTSGNTSNNTELIHDAGNRLVEIKGTVITNNINSSFSLRYDHTGAGSIIKRLFDKNNIEQPERSQYFTLDEKGNIATLNYYNATFDEFEMREFVYNSAGFIKTIHGYTQGVRDFVEEFHYKGNTLDSLTFFRINPGIPPEKVFVVVFEYDRSKRNTVDNYHLFNGIGNTQFDQLDRYGKNQSFAIKKETEFRFDSQGRYIEDIIDYEYEHNEQGMMTKLNGVVTKPRYQSTPFYIFSKTFAYN